MATKFFEQNKAEKLDLPPQSSDLNRVKNPRALLDAKTPINGRNNEKDVLVKPAGRVECHPRGRHKLNLHLTKCFRLVINKKGGHIPY